MARNKLADQARKAEVQRREQRPEEAGNPGDWGQIAPGPSPSQEVAARDLLQQFRDRLTEEERALAEQRAAGGGWGESAAAQGGSPEALRKKLTRALDRVAGELGLEEGCPA